MQTILFRADGNPLVGMGHIMRCLSIADAARDMGYQCIFVTADENCSKIIKEKGYKNFILYTDYKNLNKELNVFFSIIKNVHPELLFVDSYYVSEQYLRTVKEISHLLSSKLIFVDDILAFAYPVDILINYNIYALDKIERYQRLYKKAQMDLPQLLLGTKYVPLRSEFQGIAERRVRIKAQNILISTGGSDFEHMGLAFINYIVNRGDEFKDFIFHFIIGGMNGDIEKIKKLIESCELIILHCNVSNMQEIMWKCDVAISAAGSTLYELCATQTPTITYILADNQILGATGFTQHNILKSYGDVRVLGTEVLSRKLINAALELANNYQARKAIASSMKAVVDGNGAKRIVEEGLRWKL